MATINFAKTLVSCSNRTLGLTGVLAVSGALFLASCAKEQEINAYADPTIPADKLYNEALANIDAGDVSQAKRKFTKLDRQHPYSKYAKKSGVMTTYLAYRAGEYPEAIARGKRFVSLYPANKEAPYAMYLIGMSHYRQINDITRDQKAARDTYRSMNDLIERYPDSEYVEDAKRKRRIAKDQLAGKEMLVGRYYQERREHLAAINRFRGVVEQFEDTRHVEEALARLTESYYALGSILRRRRPPPCWDTISLTVSGIKIPMPCLKKVGFVLWKIADRGFRKPQGQ